MGNLARLNPDSFQFGASIKSLPASFGVKPDVTEVWEGKVDVSMTQNVVSIWDNAGQHHRVYQASGNPAWEYSRAQLIPYPSCGDVDLRNNIIYPNQPNKGYIEGELVKLPPHKMIVLHALEAEDQLRP
jgi:hypothetical protein